MKRIKTPSHGAQIVRVPLRSKKESITIVAAGDFHIGSDSFNEFAFQEFCKQMQEEAKLRHVYMILMGDIFDGIMHTDKRFTRSEQIATMTEAQDFMCGAMKPLTANKRIHIVGSLTGNHELSYSGGDNDPIYQMYEITGIEPLGSKCFIYFDLVHAGKVLSTIRTVAFHGASGARTVPGRLRIVRNFLEENSMTWDEMLRQNLFAFYGHMHSTRVEENIVAVPEPRNKRFKTCRNWACITGQFHDTANFKAGSYPIKKGYSPMPVGYVKIVIAHNSHPTVEAITRGLNPMVDDVIWSDQ